MASNKLLPFLCLILVFSLIADDAQASIDQPGNVVTKTAMTAFEAKVKKAKEYYAKHQKYIHIRRFFHLILYLIHRQYIFVK